MAACNIRQCFLIKVSTTIREDVPAAGDMLGACNDWSTARSSTTRLAENEDRSTMVVFVSSRTATRTSAEFVR
ncbi:hypothetical protein EJB05_00537 [Eragrostis curvula]|uniref:Uncharacterized protein n=1 Tax=Eragrostis curvula TaxID=38414 RepID=A0A5J9WLZ1_9POAL|nr:hypothetical protein EJB05_00537 [Eragrostis curvula]